MKNILTYVFLSAQTAVLDVPPEVASMTLSSIVPAGSATLTQTFGRNTVQVPVGNGVSGGSKVTATLSAGSTITFVSDAPDAGLGGSGQVRVYGARTVLPAPATLNLTGDQVGFNSFGNKAALTYSGLAVLIDGPAEAYTVAAAVGGGLTLSAYSDVGAAIKKTAGQEMATFTFSAPLVATQTYGFLIRRTGGGSIAMPTWAPADMAEQHGETPFFVATGGVAVTQGQNRRPAYQLLSPSLALPRTVLGHLSPDALPTTPLPTLLADGQGEVVLPSGAAPYLRTRHEGVNYRVALVPE